MVKFKIHSHNGGETFVKEFNEDLKPKLESYSNGSIQIIKRQTPKQVQNGISPTIYFAGDSKNISIELL